MNRYMNGLIHPAIARRRKMRKTADTQAFAETTKATQRPGSGIYCAAATLALLVAGWLGGIPAQAQASYGSVVGTVTDTTGAIVPGAKLVLKNTETNATQQAMTGSAGNFTFVNLIPDTYELTVSKQGFQSQTHSAINVQVGGATRVDVTLKVGNVSQTVTVTASQAGLQTQDASLGGVVQGQQVVEAPLNGRNVNNLLDFVPGVVPGGGTQGSTMANGGSGNFQAGGQTQAIAYNNYQIGGGFSGQSIFYVDGMKQNIAENNVNPLVPTQDSVQEFRVSTNNVSAQFGGFNGGVVQIVTKSGTNKFHGNFYEYFRNTALDANDWFSNHDGLGKAPLHQNQYGVNLGGPIVKNKAFFYFSWERESLLSASPMSATVPTKAELSGDFSQDPQTIYCPAVGSYNCTPGQPLPGNKLTYIDPTALKILELETPNESRVMQKPFTTNFYASAPIEGYQNQFNARVDIAPDPNDSLFVRYTFWNPHNGPSDPFGTLTGAGRTGNYTQEAEIGENHVFNASTIAAIHLSYLENYNFQYPLSNGFDMSKISPTYAAIESQSENRVGQLPGLGIQGYGIGAEQSQLYWNNNVWGINGSLTKVLNRNTIKAGFEWRQLLWEAYGNWAYALNATPYYTASSATDSTTGNALASFLMGIPSSTTASYIISTHAFQHSYAFYVTDTWQATKKLTVNAGLRWSQPGAYSEENNLNTILQPNAAVKIGGLSSIQNPVTNTAVPLTGRLALVASPEYQPRREEFLHWNLFAPRLGLAYQVIPNTVFRMGYGISYLPPNITQDGPQLSPITRSNTNITNTVGQPLVATVSNPLPNGFLLPGGHTQSALDAQLGGGLWAVIPKTPYGYVQQWNVAVQRGLGRNSSLTLAYAGAKGTHLVIATPYTASGYNLNQLPNKYDSMGAALLKQVPNPFYGKVPSTSVIGGPTVEQGYLLEPHPQYPDGVLQQEPRYGDSTYNALQMQYTLHMKDNGILQVAYTWGKLLSDTDNTSSFEDGQGGTGLVQDNYNLKAEKSLSEQDIANNMVIDYGVDLPFGRGQRFFGRVGRAANEAIGGWRINGITIFRSGTPVSFTTPPNILSQFGGGTEPFGPGQSGIIRPDYIQGCNKSAPGAAHSAERAKEWFNTACFKTPGEFSFGNEPRVDPSIRSDGEANFDVAFNKFFNLPKAVKFKFTTEVFNLFNHPQFALPNSEAGVPGFGEVTHQANLPRTVQFAGRITF